MSTTLLTPLSFAFDIRVPAAMVKSLLRAREEGLRNEHDAPSIRVDGRAADRRSDHAGHRELSVCRAEGMEWNARVET